MTLKQKATELGIKYFLISFTDLFGVQRAKLVPMQAIDAACDSGVGFAGFAAWLDLSPADADLMAIPDEGSLLPLPWKPEVGWLAADLYLDDKPYALAPRSVLKNCLERARDQGYDFKTGVECEFFLLSPDGSVIGDPRDTQTKPCYDQQSLSRRFDLISEICDGMLQLGWGPYQIDHEDANGQFEMNWEFGDALRTADRQAFFKYMVKSLAEKHGLRATFMPKPFAHLTGNGCHLHSSLWSRETGANLFADEEGELGMSQLGYAFIAGVLQSAPSLCSLTNPSVNSYRRINAPVTSSGATWSPNAISYSGNNRTHLVRIPGPGRFELRLPDGSANPYLLPASVLAAGLDGVEHQRSPGKRLDVNLYEHRAVAEGLPRLPESLSDALDALSDGSAIRERLGSEFVAAYLKLKRREWREYMGHVSPWEREHTLDC